MFKIFKKKPKRDISPRARLALSASNLAKGILSVSNTDKSNNTTQNLNTTTTIRKSKNLNYNNNNEILQNESPTNNEPTNITSNFSSNESLHEYTNPNDNVLKIRQLQEQVNYLSDENLNIKQDKNLSIEKLEFDIDRLNEENTNLKTKLNVYSKSVFDPDAEMNSSFKAATEEYEKLQNICRMLEAQIDTFTEVHNISAIDALNNKKFKEKTPSVLKSMKKFVPNWAVNFEDLGPLVKAYHSRLENAYRKILESKETNQLLNEKILSKEETNEKLQDHLVNLSNKLEEQNKTLTSDFNQLSKKSMDKSDHDKILKNLVDEHEILVQEMKDEKEKLEKAYSIECKRVDVNIELLNTKYESKFNKLEEETVLLKETLSNNQDQLSKALETNKKYVASIQVLLDNTDKIGAELAITKSRETEWKHYVNKSVTLLEKVVQERDIYYQLAAREHETAKVALDSASSLKLQHLRDLSNMFKNNANNGSLLKHYTNGTSLNSEFKLMTVALNEKLKNDKREEYFNLTNDIGSKIDEINQQLKNDTGDSLNCSGTSILEVC